MTAIIVINSAKKNSSFLSPYLSNRRKVKVSNTVIITPTYNGIVFADKRYIAIDVPITSCLGQEIESYDIYVDVEILTYPIQ